MTVYVPMNASPIIWAIAIILLTSIIVYWIGTSHSSSSNNNNNTSISSSSSSSTSSSSISTSASSSTSISSSTDVISNIRCADCSTQIPPTNCVSNTQAVPNLTFAVFNDPNSGFTDNNIASAVVGVMEQINTDYLKYWGGTCTILTGSSAQNKINSSTKVIDSSVIPIFFVSTGDYATGQNAAAAYHSVQFPISSTNNNPHGVADSGVNQTNYLVENGSPYIVMYQVNLTTQSAMSFGLSHEILEACANPHVSKYAAQYSFDGSVLNTITFELCDPLEAGTIQQRSYTTPINNTVVSNFVLPAWFNNALVYRGSNAPLLLYDVRNVLTAPFQQLTSSALTAKNALDANNSSSFPMHKLAIFNI